MWSRGRHFSPSLPGKRYRKFGSKSSHRAETLGNFVTYDALAPRPDLEVLRSFSCLYANPVLCTLCLRMCRCNRTELVTYSWNNICLQCEINTEGCSWSLFVPVSLPREEEFRFVYEIMFCEGF